MDCIRLSVLQEVEGVTKDLYFQEEHQFPWAQCLHGLPSFFDIGMV